MLSFFFFFLGNSCALPSPTDWLNVIMAPWCRSQGLVCLITCRVKANYHQWEAELWLIFGDLMNHINKSCCWEILTMQILHEICIVRTMHPMTAESFGCFCIFIAIRQLCQKLAVCRKVPSTCCDKTVVWEPLSVKSSCFHWPNAGVSTEVLLSHACVFPYCLNKEESCALVGVSWGEWKGWKILFSCFSPWLWSW